MKVPLCHLLVELNTCRLRSILRQATAGRPAVPVRAGVERRDPWVRLCCCITPFRKILRVHAYLDRSYLDRSHQADIPTLTSNNNLNNLIIDYLDEASIYLKWIERYTAHCSRECPYG